MEDLVKKTLETLEKPQEILNFVESLRDKEIIGRCVSVYDGDTCTIIFPSLYLLSLKDKQIEQLQNKLDESLCYETMKESCVKWKCRLNGIDTPELRSKNARENQAAHEARNRLISLIQGRLVTLKCHGADKYGRLLIDLFDFNDKRHINQLMLQEGFAVKYDGKRKQAWFA